MAKLNKILCVEPLFVADTSWPLKKLPATVTIWHFRIYEISKNCQKPIVSTEQLSSMKTSR